MYDPQAELAKLDTKTVQKISAHLPYLSETPYNVLVRAIRFSHDGSGSQPKNFIEVYGVRFAARRIAEIIGIGPESLMRRARSGLSDGDLLRPTRDSRQAAKRVSFHSCPVHEAFVTRDEIGCREELRRLAKYHRDRAVSVLKYGRHLDDGESDAGETGRAPYDTLRCRNASFEGVRSTGLMEAS